jgi:hypothetical protein
MRNPHREPQLRLEILRILDACRGYLLPQTTLRNHLALLLAPAPEEAEFAAALQALAGQSAILALPSALGGETRWKITDEGRALLLEHLRA